MTSIDILGYIAAIATTGAFIPQTIKVYKSNKTDDLSLSTFTFFQKSIIKFFINLRSARKYP